MRQSQESIFTNISVESLILNFEKQKGKTIEEKWEDVRKMEEERIKNTKQKEK